MAHQLCLKAKGWDGRSQLLLGSHSFSYFVCPESIHNTWKENDLSTKFSLLGNETFRPWQSLKVGKLLWNIRIDWNSIFLLLKVITNDIVWTACLLTASNVSFAVQKMAFSSSGNISFPICSIIIGFRIELSELYFWIEYSCGIFLKYWFFECLRFAGWRLLVSFC